MTYLFQQVADAIAAIPDGWTSQEKGCAMAAAIVALRPRYSVEIGVFAGKGLVAMGLAHKAIGFGMAIGVDPYSKQASYENQTTPEDKAFWATLDHELIFNKAKENLFRFSINNTARIERKRSDEFDPPDGIGVIRVDGDHSFQALADVKRYSPFVERGGIAFIDDLDWASKGGGTVSARDWLLDHGWRSLYVMDEKENGGITEVLQKK